MDPESTEFKLVAGVLGTVLGGGLFILLNGYLLATRGQTIGKYFMKTQIVSNDDRLVPLGWLLLKRYMPLWVISQFPLVGPIFALANALAIFRAQRKCFHDDIADTKVIQII
jgi:uncharacterized RDD family membrane protein YckC